MTSGSALRPRPLFSVVAAVYNVERYLPEFIASVEGQSLDQRQIEVVVVDDGSTDGSLALLEAWARRQPALVKVVTKANGGQASARNLGLEHATGTWVTFSDPDDIFDRDYFRAGERFAAAHPEVEIMGARIIVLDEALGRRVEHTRARQYDAGPRVVDLRDEPNVFPGGTNLCSFRLDRIKSAGLRFDARLRPTFEDVHFTARFVLGLPEPIVGIVPTMGYIYRKRATNDSTLQRAWSHPGRFTDVLELGHLDLLERARSADGSIRAWVQQLVIYDLSWYISEDEKPQSLVRIDPSVLDRFHELFRRVCGLLDPAVVRAHTVRAMEPRWSDLLAHGCRGEPWHSSRAEQTKVDPEMRLRRIVYRFVGDGPVDAFTADGRSIEPSFAKTRSCVYFDRTFMSERIAWLPVDVDLELRLDGQPIPIGPPASGSVRSPRERAQSAIRTRDAAWLGRLAYRGARLALARGLARLPLWRSYRDAWVLMDRMDDAGDNAERLFEHLRAERPDVNAWFVVERDTPAWNRLRPAYGGRLVARGSLRWAMLMLRSSWLISSHADRGVVEPPQITSVGLRRTWKLAFLGHGVTQIDLSRWLNTKDFDFIATTTPDERRSMVEDGTPYGYTAREVRQTGMPRFDRLLALGRAVDPGARDLILISPTWRKWFAASVDIESGNRGIDPAVWDSDYLTNWLAVVRSTEVAAAASRRGWQVGFMPHPVFQALLPSLEVPPYVQRLSFDDDVQGYFARAALVVTDYSSVAFDAAALDRPIVYFQFDRDAFFGGGHIGDRGYFDYDRDGFGPVATTAAEAIRAIVASIESGPRTTAEFQARIDRTFIQQDGRACARVVGAIEELSREYVTTSGR
ncbi:MAG: CDP-glycerol glycerophosphotransferase family protein [Candidatus Limnocylindrales bacterium]